MAKWIARLLQSPNRMRYQLPYIFQFNLPSHPPMSCFTTSRAQIDVGNNMSFINFCNFVLLNILCFAIRFVHSTNSKPCLLLFMEKINKKDVTCHAVFSNVQSFLAVKILFQMDVKMMHM